MRLLHSNALPIYLPKVSWLFNIFESFRFVISILFFFISFLNKIECYVTGIEFPCTKFTNDGKSENEINLHKCCDSHFSHTSNDDNHVCVAFKKNRLIDLNSKIYMFSLNCVQNKSNHSNRLLWKATKERILEGAQRKEKNVYRKLKYWCRYNVCPFE